jgi:type IV pilus assembly protein PilM
MDFLPRTMGTRPRLACEVRAEGVVAARSEDASAVLSAVSRAPLADGVMVPRLGAVEAGAAIATAAGGVGFGAAGREALVAAVRKALEAVALRNRDVTLVVPDAAVRVLLLDFDSLPAKPAEALPVVRFRLKKLLPFDADDAAVSYQVMSSTRDTLHVMAVAMPREVLADYEGVVREAGFEPGAVLPSTLAALAGLSEGERPM